MGDKSGIEWTDATWQVTRGCEYASEGCRSCYAAALTATRLAHTPAYEGLAVKHPGEPAEFTGEVRLVPTALSQPLRWRQPRRIFVDSMSDLFHPSIPVAYLAQVFAVMALAGQHQFQVLTKRPQRMANVLSDVRFSDLVQEYASTFAQTGTPVKLPAAIRDRVRGRESAWLSLVPWPAPNVWCGSSIELDKYSWRANHVRNTPAAVRFLSLEPLLGPLPSLDLTGIDWAIVGAESGAGARPMDLSWARDIRDRCADAGVALFVKQLSGGFHAVKELDLFPADLRIRQWPANAAPVAS